MKILITGAHGFVGSALTTALEREGHLITRLVRPSSGLDGDHVLWDPAKAQIDVTGIGSRGIEGVVHLAGESIAGRWTKRRKAMIRESRVEGTRLLAEALSRLARRPSVLVAASAVGYYGDRGEDALTEESAPGDGFLAEVCQAWERSASLAEPSGLRVVKLRIGVVLGAGGGALAKMLLPFRLGLGGPMGSGRQYMSWISRDDLVAIATMALTDRRFAGPINCVSPHPTTNRDLTRALARAVKRPAFIPVPEIALRAAWGEMADDALLASTRVLPKRLLAWGYSFRHPELDPLLEAIVRGR